MRNNELRNNWKETLYQSVDPKQEFDLNMFIDLLCAMRGENFKILFCAKRGEK